VLGDHCCRCCRRSRLCKADHISIPQSLASVKNSVHRATVGQMPGAHCSKSNGLSLRKEKGNMIAQQSYQLLVILLLVVGIVIVGTIFYHKNWARKTRWGLLWLLLVGISWYLLFWYFTLTVMRVLAPWDQWAQLAPQPGTWERHLNDFFKDPTHAYLAGAWLTGISMGIFFVRLLRERYARGNLPIAFTITNFGFLFVALSLIQVVSNLPDVWLPQPRSSLDYHRIWLDRVVTTILIILLWGTQVYIRLPLRSNR